MGDILQQIFMPNRQAVIFATKGVIAMSLALFIAFSLQLDRPYWALISAIFLQIRPESGMVIEKLICQILGTIVGGIFAIFILNYFMDAPYIALTLLGLWLGINSGLSALMRRVNFIYAFAMAGVTAEVIILLSVINISRVSSQYIFSLAQSRITEIIIGAMCAALVSNLFWPVKVKNILRKKASSSINQTLNYLAFEIDHSGSHEDRHQKIDGIMQTLTELSDDSSAVNYEGPDGPAHARAANHICDKVLSLLADIQIIGRLQRLHPELVTSKMSSVIEQMHETFVRLAQATDNFEENYQSIKSYRRKLAEYKTSHPAETPLEARFIQICLLITSNLVSLLKAHRALTHRDRTLLHGSSIIPYRDPLTGLTTGFRTTVMFAIAALIWVYTGAYATVMIMILPVIFSIMLARLPLLILSVVLKRMLIGVVVAIFVSIFYALSLLARSNGEIELLILILAAPYFLGLMLFTNRPTMPYGIGFCLCFTVLVRPSGAANMVRSFSIGYTASAALAIFVGVSILFWIFKLIGNPSIQLMVKRLFRSIYHDLLQLSAQENSNSWFNRRMVDRLLRLTTYDQRSENRVVTDLALTGLNLGHISIRMRLLCENLVNHKLTSLPLWQRALAEAFLRATQGRTNLEFEQASKALLHEILTYTEPSEQTEMIEGMFQRMNMTFKRSAQAKAETLI